MRLRIETRFLPAASAVPHLLELGHVELVDPAQQLGRPQGVVVGDGEAAPGGGRPASRSLMSTGAVDAPAPAARRA